MKTDKGEEQRTIDKFRLLYAHRQGGIFWGKTRERIMTKRGLSGRSRAINTFWYRQRENVKTALIDLQLFIEMAGKDQVNQVVTRETLKPVVEALLSKPIEDRAKAELTRAEIAQLFIETGFNYLRATQPLPQAIHETLNNASDSIDFLIRNFPSEPKSLERYFRFVP